MSEQEKSGHNVAEESSLVVVEKEPSTGSRHRGPFRPTELKDDQSDVHIRSKAPAVPSVVEELKNNPDGFSASTVQGEKQDRKEIGNASTESHKRVSKKSSSKRRGSSTPSETIALTTIEVEPIREKLTLPSQPIPADVISATSDVSELLAKSDEKKADVDSIAGEIAELPTPATAKKDSEWSDDEEASGLPRSLSRASRVSRAVRQLFCCGTAYSPASEDDISNHRMTSGI